MISKFLQTLCLQPRSFSQSLEHFFLTVGQNNFDNKIPLYILNTIFFSDRNKNRTPRNKMDNNANTSKHRKNRHGRHKSVSVSSGDR